jgi:hypothetical protein
MTKIGSQDSHCCQFEVLKLLYDVGVPFSAFFWTYTVLGMLCPKLQNMGIRESRAFFHGNIYKWWCP